MPNAARSTDKVPQPGPTVSAIVPVYNALATLGRALSSIAAQTYPHVAEIIVVDDGSEEDTAAFLGEHFPGVTCLRQEHTGIPGAARNRGAAAATGELLAFLDADDEWLPDKLERQVALLAAAPDLGLVVTRAQHRRLDERLHAPPATLLPDPWRLDLARWLNYDFRAAAGFHACPSSWLIRREVWEALGGQDTAWPDNGDWHLITRALLAGVPTVMVMTPTYIYHCDLASQSHRLVWRGLAAQARRVLGFLQDLAAREGGPVLPPEVMQGLLHSEARTYGAFLVRYGYPGAALEMDRLAWRCRVPLARRLRVLPGLALLPLLAHCPEPWEPWCRLMCTLRNLKWGLRRTLGRQRAGPGGSG